MLAVSAVVPNFRSTTLNTSNSAKPNHNHTDTDNYCHHTSMDGTTGSHYIPFGSYTVNKPSHREAQGNMIYTV